MTALRLTAIHNAMRISLLPPNADTSSLPAQAFHCSLTRPRPLCFPLDLSITSSPHLIYTSRIHHRACHPLPHQFLQRIFTSSLCPQRLDGCFNYFIHILSRCLVFLIQSLIYAAHVGWSSFISFCRHSPPLSALPRTRRGGPLRVLVHGSRKEGLREVVDRCGGVHVPNFDTTTSNRFCSNHSMALLKGLPCVPATSTM